jgi:excisionase family DNA binding protein
MEITDRTLIDTLRARRTLLTVPEFATLLCLAERTVYAAIKQGRIPSIRVLGSVRLDPKVTADWLAGCTLG